MPRISDDMETHQLSGGNFNFSGTRIEHLSATEYTLVTLAVDITGSVTGFVSELEEMVALSIQGCQKSPRSENLLVRVIAFNTSQGVFEVHGFKPLSEINANDYAGVLRPGGMTNLIDACYSAAGATNAYAKALQDQDYNANAVTFIITDGADNASVSTMKMLKKELEASVTGEVLESHVSVLIGINAAMYSQELQKFKADSGLTQYIDAGDANRGRLAKLAAFVSQSVSSTSQALGTGGPSQAISASI